MLIGLLHPVPPYDFDLSVGLSRFHSVLDRLRDGDYWRALNLDDTLALVRVANQGTVEAPELAVYRMAATGPVDDARLLSKVGHLLGADADMKPFYAHARLDPPLWRLVEPLYGLKHVRAASLFEALMTTIIEQQIALNMAQRGERWLIEWAGKSLPYDGETFYTFPPPEAIATASVEDLLPLKITGIRIRVMIDVACKICDGVFDPDALHTPEAARQALIQLKGIGEWTAAWTIIRALGQYAYVGENDVALQAAINAYYFGEQGRLPQPVVKDTLARYGSFAGAAAFHILMQWGLQKYGS